MKFNIVQTPFKSIYSNSTFDTLFDNFLNSTQAKQSNHMTVPRANVIRNENGYSIELAAPGFSRDEFELIVDNNTLTVTVHTEDTAEYERSVMAREYKFQNFTRSWVIPEQTNTEGIEARYDAGILYIDVPVEAPIQGRKSITVQ